jgi:glycosyltransferase involved in cell wall biosynthesis
VSAAFTPSDLTVVIPARDAAVTVGATIASLVGQQAGVPKIVVVDDASVDDTVAVAREAAGGHDLVIITGRGEGPGAARNRGLAAVHTELVAFCDADDTWVADRLGPDLQAFAVDDELQVLLGRTRFEAEDPALFDRRRFDCADQTALIPHFGAATVRRSVFDDVGPIDEDLANYEDYEWFYRARDAGVGIVTHDRVVQCHHLRAGSTSRLNPPEPADLLALIHGSLERRRAAGRPQALRLEQLGRTS